MPQILTPVARPRRVGKYLDLPEEMRAEYLDARALLNPAPALAHQLTYRRLSRHRGRRSPAPTEAGRGPAISRPDAAEHWAGARPGHRVGRRHSPHPSAFVAPERPHLAPFCVKTRLRRWF